MISFEDWTTDSSKVAVGDVSVALQDRGPRSAPVLTYCHGYPSSSHDIAEVWSQLGDWRLIAVDFIGFGASDKPRGYPLTVH